MSAGAETVVNHALGNALGYRDTLEVAQGNERLATVTFMDAALANGWNWTRIGGALGITATGARRYYQRNRRSTHV